MRPLGGLSPVKRLVELQSRDRFFADAHDSSTRRWPRHRGDCKPEPELWSDIGSIAKRFPQAATGQRTRDCADLEARLGVDGSCAAQLDWRMAHGAQSHLDLLLPSTVDFGPNDLMAENMPSRKLATIVGLDVDGYSARKEGDEAKTTAEVANLRKIIESIAESDGGRVFNSAGDGFMLEFGSSLSAVEAAQEFAERCEPKVRVGVHVGDVAVQPNGDLLGHGVNVAARLMARSAPGAVLVSADVRRMIRGPIAERMLSRGMMQLDKMAETIEGFALPTSAPSTVIPQVKDSEPLLAVLPFDNLSNDPEMQFFSDGVSEEIMQRLMRGAKLKVVGRTSSFQFRGERKPDAARALNCTHVLDGSVRRAAANVRVSAHLVETRSQTTLWSDRFDSDLGDIFAVQDQISESIASALRRTFYSVSSKAIDPAAYDLYLRGIRTAFVSEDLTPGI